MRAEDVGNRETWLARAPGLHISGDAVRQAVRAFRPSNSVAADLDERLRDDGYFQLAHDFGLDLSRMADTVRRFSDAAIPPVFCFLFDEFWAPFQALDAMYGGILGPYGLLPDFWVWNVDPAKGEAGWTPHRDRGRFALRPDGRPITLTTWIPLSDATPLNSCMYVVPAHADPTYGTPHENEYLFELPAIRALPAKAGDVLVWNQAVIHWGSRTSHRATESRVSMAFEFQANDSRPFNKPILPPNEPIPFELRLRLIAKQVLQYRHMYKVDPQIEQVATELVGQL
ncbi:MAG: phytanoyl-CoA dioxygenase family protein [Bauldia sp.]